MKNRRQSRDRALKFPARIAFAACLLGGLALTAHADDTDTVSLPDFAVNSPRIANQDPAASMSMPVSALRYEPRVDLEARNLPEAQADVTIRGGIFENSGFKIGATSLYDPQTGHYFAEIPVAPEMLGAPQVLTGAGNAVQGFDADVGTIAYGWRPIENRGAITVGAGEYEFDRESFYQGATRSIGSGETLAGDVEWAHSESAGSVPYGDHNFQRIGGRIQLRDNDSQTDFYAGYQHKYFGWPNLYTPFGFDETEDLQTVLLAANHCQQDAAGNVFEIGGYYRRNHDDYELDRFHPGLFNPYQHETWVRGIGIDGVQQMDGFALNYSAQYAADNLESTALVFGPYSSRAMLKISAVPEKTFPVEQGTVTVKGGVAYDRSNRDGSAFSPIGSLEWKRTREQTIYAEYAQSTQLPTYTALKSSPTGGLFLGNAALGRETSRNLETGVRQRWGDWSVEAAAFYRWDNHLVDWTYRNGVTARVANAVDIGTAGFELLASRHVGPLDLVLGCTLLTKNADYGAATVDASFYALNYPKVRVTAAITWRLGAGFELRSDNQFRVEEPNALRTVGGDQAVLSSLGLYYLPPRLRGWEFAVQADNLWDSNFEEVPSVPAARRQVVGSVTRRW
ncbi:MAG TPA: TonB-dependent receptor [Candidatus Didemnitutus sp.]|nr:TonB-dependent receptor [Candidatus Didemnitutus sp.]